MHNEYYDIDMWPTITWRDFNSESHLTLGQGLRSVTVPIEILNDELFESSFETFSVTLSSDVNRLQIHVGNSEAVVTIIDDDCECKLPTIS